MSDDFDRHIETKQAALEQAKAQMESIRQQFIGVATRLAGPWYQKQASSVVQSEHTTTSDLADDKLKSLKAEVANLVTNAEQPVAIAFGSTKLWWHLQSPLPDLDAATTRGENNWRYRGYGHGPPETLQRALRFGLGALATILEKYGYLNTRVRGLAWRESEGSNSQPYYPFMVEWSPEMVESLEAYATKQDEADRLRQEIAQIMEKKKQAMAKARWDSV
jgi:hypothetical protein